MQRPVAEVVCSTLQQMLQPPLSKAAKALVTHCLQHILVQGHGELQLHLVVMPFH